MRVVPPPSSLLPISANKRAVSTGRFPSLFRVVVTGKPDRMASGRIRLGPRFSGLGGLHALGVRFFLLFGGLLVWLDGPCKSIAAAGRVGENGIVKALRLHPFALSCIGVMYIIMREHTSPSPA